METNGSQFDPKHRSHKKSIQPFQNMSVSKYCMLIHDPTWELFTKCPEINAFQKSNVGQTDLKDMLGCWIIDSDMDAIVLYVFRLSSYFTCWTTSLWPTTMCTCTRGGERWSDGVWLSPPCSVSPLAFCTSSLEPREHSKRFAPFQPIQTTALLANT